MAAVIPDARKDWDILELEIAGAINVGTVGRADLTGPVHNLFIREKWKNIDDNEFNLLLPSLRLASNFIASGMDYLTEFLGSKDIHDDLGDRYHSVPRQEHVIVLQHGTWPDEELNEARSALDEIAVEIEWTINHSMGEKGALGMTRHIKQGPYAQEPWGPIDIDAIRESDRSWKLQGRDDRRPLLVGIMSQYLKALKQYAPGTDNHLRAAFYAAVTIAHEVGHVVWCQNYADLNYGDMGIEPFVDNYAQAELGFCFEAFLFSGFHVRTSKITADSPLDFECAAVWNPYLTVDLTRQPNRLLYRTQYSISVAYMQQLLTQAFWDRLGDQKANDYSQKAVAALKPRTDLGVNLPPATANVRNWTLGISNGKVIWLNQFVDRGDTPDLTNRVPRGEIEMVKEELRPFYKKVMRPMQNPFGEDDDEEFDFVGEDYEIDDPSQLTAAERHQLVAEKEPYIDDGVVRMDYGDSSRVLSFDLTRVEVKYVPPRTVKAVSAKRARSPNDDDGSAPAKRQKPDLVDKYGPRSIDDLLERNLPEVFEDWTRVEARDYAIKEGFSPGPLPQNESLQRSRLDMNKQQDSYMIERIRCFHFNLFEKEFKDDNYALVKIKQARLLSVPGWSIRDLKDLCEIHGQWSGGADTSVLPSRARRVLRQDLESAIAVLKTADPEALVPSAFRKDYDKWTDTQFNDFFEKNNLPQWGDPSIRRLRVERFREQEATGSRPDRSSIMVNRDGYPHPRVDQDGVELYGFDVVLEQSTVASLKSDLFRVAKIPANHDINLYFGNDRKSPLEDGKPLALYESRGKRNWLGLQMTTIRREDAIPVPVPTLPVYVPKVPKDAGSSNATSGPTKTPPATPPPIDPAYQRNYDLRNPKPDTAARTFTERMQEISRRGAELEKVVIAGGGVDQLRPHLKAVIANSAAEMLDTLEDIDEVNAMREREIDEYVKNYGKAVPVASANANNVPAKAPEHMKDVFSRLKGRKF